MESHDTARRFLGRLTFTEAAHPDVPSSGIDFSMANNLATDLNLYADTHDAPRRCLIQLQLNYNPSLGRHEGVVVIANEELYRTLSSSPEFVPLLDRYFDQLEYHGQEFLRKWDAGSNLHQVRSIELTLNGNVRRLELIHQTRPGDCVLATFLSTCSLERGGQLPMSIVEARRLAIELRRDAGQESDDIEELDTPLSYRDVVSLYATVLGSQPKQEDVLTIEGRGRTRSSIECDVLDILEYLDGYTTGLCTTGLANHSRTLKHLGGDAYLLIDPMRSDIARVLNTEQLISDIAQLCLNRERNENFFFFVRSQEDRH